MKNTNKKMLLFLLFILNLIVFSIRCGDKYSNHIFDNSLLERLSESILINEDYLLMPVNLEGNNEIDWGKIA